MTNNSKITKIISLIILSCFIFTQAGWAGPVSQLRALRGTDTTLAARLKDVFGQHEIINDQLGKLIQEDKNLGWFVAQDLISENEAKELKAILSGEKTDYDVEKFYGLLRKLGRPLSKFTWQEIFEYFREVLADKNEAFTERFSIEQIDDEIWLEIFSFIRPKTEEDWFEAEDLANLVIANMPPEVEKLGITNKGEDCFEHIGLRPHIVWLALGNRDRLDVLEDMLHGIFEYLIIAREVRKVADEAEYKDLGLVTDGKINWEAVVKLRNENSYRSGYFFAKAHKQAYEMLARYLKRIARDKFLAENHEMGLLVVYCDRQARNTKDPEQAGREKEALGEPADTLLASQAGGKHKVNPGQVARLRRQIRSQTGNAEGRINALLKLIEGGYVDADGLRHDKNIIDKRIKTLNGLASRDSNQERIMADDERVSSTIGTELVRLEQAQGSASTGQQVAPQADESERREQTSATPEQLNAWFEIVIDRQKHEDERIEAAVKLARHNALTDLGLARHRFEYRTNRGMIVTHVVSEGVELLFMLVKAKQVGARDDISELSFYDEKFWKRQHNSVVGETLVSLGQIEQQLQKEISDDTLEKIGRIRTKITRTQATKAVEVKSRPKTVFVFRKGMAEAIRPIVEASLPEEQRKNCLVVEVEDFSPEAIAKAIRRKIVDETEIDYTNIDSLYYICDHGVENPDIDKIRRQLGFRVRNFQAVYFLESYAQDGEGLTKILGLLEIEVKNIQAALLSAQAMQSI